jgi:hypothetical protein
MTVTTVATYTPTDRAPTVYALGASVAAVYLHNHTQCELRVLTSTGQSATVPAYDRTVLQTNATFGTWLAISPFIRRINPPYNATNTLSVVSYDTGDALPDGTTYTTVYMSPAQVRQHDELERLTGAEYLNVKYFGARGDGVTDDTTAITAALSFANTIGGAAVFFPAGTYLTGTQTLYANVHLRGAGILATVLKLKNGANADLLSAQTNLINLSAAAHSGSTGTLANYGIYDMTLDGNQANQSGGPSWCIRMYGYNGRFENLDIRNGYSGGVQSDWNGSGTPTGGMEHYWSNIKIHDCVGVSLEHAGPHDSIATNLEIFNSTHTTGLHLAPNATGFLCTNLHIYGCNFDGNPPLLCETQYAAFHNATVENNTPGSPTLVTPSVVIAGQNCKYYGTVIATGSNLTYAIGFQMGQAAGQTPYTYSTLQAAGVTTAGQAQTTIIHAQVEECQGGAFWWVNDGGRGMVKAMVHQTGGVGYASSTNAPNTSTTDITVVGLTPDGTPSLGGEIRIVNKSTQALLLTQGQAGLDLFYFDTSNKRLQCYSGTYIRGFSDVGSTKKWYISEDGLGSFVGTGSLGMGQSTSAAATATGGTIATAGVTAARVNPAGNITGVILTAGSALITGSTRILWVVNESAFTVTFAASGTSNVADGASDVIAAGTARCFIWDTGTSLWYKAV